jgi:hypothetical protein
MLGNLRVAQQSRITPNSAEFQTGFYAIKYVAGANDLNFAAGTTIVSYRGTNPDGPLMINLIKDALPGYGPAIGFANGPQAAHAVEP